MIDKQYDQYKKFIVLKPAPGRVNYKCRHDFYYWIIRILKIPLFHSFTKNDFS